MRVALVLTLALALTACGGEAEEDRVTTVDLPGREGDPMPPPPPMIGPTEDDLAKLEDRDCRVVAEAYANAILRRNFAFAEMFWTPDAADREALETRYGGYTAPRFTIADVREEGAAGSLYCTVTGALGDASHPDRPLRQGEIVLRRANDVPGATPEQLRWSIRSAEFEEEMPRGGRGDPA